MARTKDTQLRAIYEKFNKLRDTSNVLSEQMNPREKRQLESSFRAINTNIDYIKKEVKIISKLLMKQGMKKSVKEIQNSFWEDNFAYPEAESKNTKLDDLKYLKELYDEGLIDDEEFEAMKKEVLGK